MEPTIPKKYSTLVYSLRVRAVRTFGPIVIDLLDTGRQSEMIYKSVDTRRTRQ